MIAFVKPLPHPLRSRENRELLRQHIAAEGVWRISDGDMQELLDMADECEKYRAALQAICNESEEHEAYRIAKKALD